MKVCVIGYNPTSGPYTYGSVSMWAANGWEYNGHEVLRFDRSEMEKLPKKADLYFFVDCSEDYSQTMPDDLDGIKVFWAMDTAMPAGLERTVNIARKVDYTFCTNAEAFGPKFLMDKYGIEATWVPYGYDHTLQREIVQVYQSEFLHGHNKGTPGEIFKYDVSMVGNPNSPEREALWNLLEEKYGERAFIRTVQTREEYVRGKALSRIVVNQPTYSGGKPVDNIINLRVFNALASGKLLLCQKVSIKEHDLLGLKDGVNVVYWDGFDDLIQKIDYYLAHPYEADVIAAAGMRLGDKYLMSNQVRIMEQVIYSRFYERLINENFK